MGLQQELQTQEVLSRVLAPLDTNSEVLEKQAMEVLKRLQGEQCDYEQIRRSKYEKHGVLIKMAQASFEDTPSDLTQTGEWQKSVKIHTFFLNSYQTKCDQLLACIRTQRQAVITLKTRLNGILTIKRLCLIKKNISLYKEQLQVISSVKRRVEQELSNENSNLQWLQSMVNKPHVPYHFYLEYCLKACCEVIEKRLSKGQLSVIRSSHSTPALLLHVHWHFFLKGTLVDKCHTYLALQKAIRVIDEEGQLQPSGLTHIFKGQLIEALKNSPPTGSETFLKARSVMQNSEQSLSIWKELQAKMTQQYHKWCKETTQLLVKINPLQLVMVKQAVSYHQQVYAWTEVIGSKWVESILALLLIRAIMPVLEKIRGIISTDKRDNEWRKHENYVWFTKASHIYFLLIRGNAEIEQDQNISELNQQQHQLYYAQAQELLLNTFKKPLLAMQFRDLWSTIHAQYYARQGQTTQSNHEVWQEKMRVIRDEQKLRNLVSWGKIDEDESQAAYGLLMRLNFTSTNYPLLKKTATHLGKTIEQQWQNIRRVAYKQATWL